MGKAYGFFECRASKEAIELEIPTIRRLVKTPSKLELSLIEGMENVRGDSRLISLAKAAKEQGINYLLDATYPDATNRETADELSAILNQAYQSPLYGKREPFMGEIIYEENGEYVFRE